MKRFDEFGINTLDNKHIFQVPQISITEVLNCEIEVLDFESGVKTPHGENRYVVKVRHEGNECKFFTSASPIKEALNMIPKDGFPFLTTIKQQRFGNGNNKTYHFT